MISLDEVVRKHTYVRFDDSIVVEHLGWYDTPDLKCMGFIVSKDDAYVGSGDTVLAAIRNAEL